MINVKVIKSIEQYHQYCDEVERIASQAKVSPADEERMELLAVLIEKWDDEHAESKDMHPVEMLRTLMDMHAINANDLSKVTGIDKTVLSKILNSKKGFSKENIRALANYFKVNQEAFNKPYDLASSASTLPRVSRSTIA